MLTRIDPRQIDIAFIIHNANLLLLVVFTSAPNGG